MRREMERREVERRVERLRVAGGPSAMKNIEKVLAASPRVRGLAALGGSTHGPSQPNAGVDRDHSGQSGSRPLPRSP